MSRKKLTLSVEERLTRRAKAIAKRRGTSVSRLVETFFTSLRQEEDRTSGTEPTQQREKEAPAEDEGAPTPGDEPSEWARRWRGAFASDEATYPDDPAWEEKVIAEEIEKKHAS